MLHQPQKHLCKPRTSAELLVRKNSLRQGQCKHFSQLSGRKRSAPTLPHHRNSTILPSSGCTHPQLHHIGTLTERRWEWEEEATVKRPSLLWYLPLKSSTSDLAILTMPRFEGVFKSFFGHPSPATLCPQASWELCLIKVASWEAARPWWLWMKQRKLRPQCWSSERAGSSWWWQLCHFTIALLPEAPTSFQAAARSASLSYRQEHYQSHPNSDYLGVLSHSSLA